MESLLLIPRWAKRKFFSRGGEAVGGSQQGNVATTAINALGIDLLHKTGEPQGNTVLSPYSIQCALAMAYAGAQGETRAEMARVLHYSSDEAAVHRSFSEMRKTLDELVQRSTRKSEQIRKWGATNDPITLTIANRLFGQAGFDLRAPFLSLLKDSYGALLESVDFSKDPAGITKYINTWVQNQTRQRISSLIPDGALKEFTRLVLVNAIYFGAAWELEFYDRATKQRSFHVGGGKPVDVPTMTQQNALGYAKRSGFTVVAIAYSGNEIQLLILLPNKIRGLAALEAKLSVSLFAECAKLARQDVILYLPKFKIEPPVLPLGKTLQVLGMRNAFDKPRGSADFDRIAPRRVTDYLYVSEVFHKTFLKLDEKGTEAAAATAAEMMEGEALRSKPPIEVRVDHPFFFAIQHRASATCLFLGRVTDPR